MHPFAYRPLMLIGGIVLALPACAANSGPATVAAFSPPAIDLGPSSRIPATRVAMAGAGRDVRGVVPRPESVTGGQPVRDRSDDVRATGTVNSIDVAQRKVNLTHNPIPSIGWPAMTMDFAVAPSVDLTQVKPGASVNFSIQKGKGGMYEVRALRSAGTGR